MAGKGFANFLQPSMGAAVGAGRSEGECVEQVTLLEQDEAVRLDSERLAELYVQLGEIGAEDVVCRAMEELAARLSHVERCRHEQKLPEMRKTARSLIAISEQLGMAVLARVAGDVTRCIDDQDHIALAAVLARMLRVGERSLREIWDLQDLSI